MGITGLLGQLPCESVTGFRKLKLLANKKKKVDIDTGTMIYVCALIHKEAYNAQNYIPSVREFHGLLIILSRIHKWDFTCIFDGRPPLEKQHEHSRRQAKEDTIIITSDYIAMCVEVCKGYFIPYIVAPAEADMQVCRQNNSAIAVCRDSDEIAYGNSLVIIVDSYFKEEARIYDMTVPVTDEMKEQYPLYDYYRRHGIRIIHWWAAVMGCDISEGSSGITHAGKEAFFSALKIFDSSDAPVFFSALQSIDGSGGVPSLNEESFAKALHELSRPAVKDAYSVEEIKGELLRVSKWFSKDATFYDINANIISVSGETIKQATTSSVHHMMGKVDPKTGNEFTATQLSMIQSVQPHNLMHNSAVAKEKLSGLSLPEGKTTVQACTAAELKKMIFARGGQVTGRDGKAMTVGEMRQMVCAYMSMEDANPKFRVYYDRNRQRNGIFANIDTSERQTIGQILNNLVICNEYEQCQHKLFEDAQRLFLEERFTDDFDTIVVEAPELSEEFIQKSFIHVGENKTQKNIQSGLKKVMEMDKVIYHAFAWSEDKRSIYILSKQVASQSRDEKTRNKTAPGEKPKLAEYLVIAQIRVSPTTIESHGHTLGVCNNIMYSYCAICKAGCGLCYHRAGLCWMQHLHWGDGRPTPKPATAEFCSWVAGCRSARICSSLLPASEIHIERLPGSNEEAKAKFERGIKKNMHQGISARYDVFGGDERKRALLRDPRFCSAQRFEKLFNNLRKAQMNDDLVEDEDEV